MLVVLTGLIAGFALSQLYFDIRTQSTGCMFTQKSAT